MATGVYNSYNTAKFRLQEAFIQTGKDAMTCKELAEVTGMSSGNISRLMSYYQERQYGYFIRLPKKDRQAIRYRIGKTGTRYYMKYLKRIKLGFGLNLNDQTPQRMSTFRGLRKLNMLKEAQDFVSPQELSPYIGITKDGACEMKITEETKLQAAGLCNIESCVN